MSGDPPSRTCTVAERALLDMIACWPGVPAIVTIEADGRYSVFTPGGWEKGGAVAARANASIAGPLGTSRVSHDRAAAAARCLIASHFGQLDKARITVPPRRDKDDDFVLLTYIHQQRNGDTASLEKGSSDDAR